MKDSDKLVNYYLSGVSRTAQFTLGAIGVGMLGLSVNELLEGRYENAASSAILSGTSLAMAVYEYKFDNWYNSLRKE